MGWWTMSCELYLCIYAREFPVQAMLRFRPELRQKPVVVMEGEVPFQQVCSFNHPAHKLGVFAGMSRAEMDSFPSVTLLKRSTAEERAARLTLLESAGSFSPRIEEISGNYTFGCVLDIAGSEKLFGPPQRIAMRIKESLATLGLRTSIAVSSNFHTAVCLARGTYSNQPPTVVPTGAERHALAHLPLSVLDISPEHTETFSQWGVTTLGVLAMLPEKDLIARLGQEGKRLRQLARGESSHLFLPIDPVISLEERIELDTPVEVLDSLLFGVSLMLDQLIARAAARILSLAVITAELGMDGGGLHTRIVRPALPTNEKQLWLKLLHLDWIAHPPKAGVVSMLLRAETGIVGKVQLGLFSPQLPEPGRLDVTMARIRAIVGEERAGSVELKDTYEPDAFRMKPFSVITSHADKLHEPKLPAAVMRCLRPAENAAMTLRNNCPHIFYFRGIAYETDKCYGPWRATGGWWTEGRWSIEEWDIVARLRDPSFTGRPGSQLLCCMTRDHIENRWQVQALYD
jgi:protein ImuB